MQHPGPVCTHAPSGSWVVVFTSILDEDADLNIYAQWAKRMVDRAATQPGFIGVDSARSGLGITVSYWESAEAIDAWREDFEHAEARRLGRQAFYAQWSLHVAKVERSYTNST